MAYIILPHRWTRQPQVPVDVDPVGIGAGIQFCPLFSTSALQFHWDASPLHNLVTVAGTPTGIVRDGIVGRGFDFHVSGGIYGVFSSRTPSGYIDNAGNWTAIWIGCQLASDFWYGSTIYRGNANDSVRLGFTTSTNARLSWIDSSPAQYDTDLTIPTITVGYGNYYCIAARKVGGTRYLYFKPFLSGALASTSASTGLSLGRADTSVGWGLGNSIQAAHNHTVFAAGWGRALEESEIRKVFDNPWQIFRPIQRRIYVPSAGVGGNITQALTGQAVIGSAGTLVPSHEQALSGQAATATAGTLAPGHSQALTGGAATASAGTLAPSHSQALSGSAATSAAGTLGVERTIALSGQAVTATAGTISYTTVGAVNVTLTGQAVAAEAGTLTPSHSQALTGQAVAAQAGTVAYTGGSVLTIALTGQAVTASAGTISPAVALLLSGSSIVVSAGTVTVSGALTLTAADIAAIVAAIKADPLILTVPKFLALK